MWLSPEARSQAPRWKPTKRLASWLRSNQRGEVTNPENFIDTQTESGKERSSLRQRTQDHPGSLMWLSHPLVDGDQNLRKPCRILRIYYSLYILHVL